MRSRASGRFTKRPYGPNLFDPDSDTDTDFLNLKPLNVDKIVKSQKLHIFQTRS
jgi:hypothetical protein